jgi:putative ABC transport system permease protein
MYPGLTPPLLALLAAGLLLVLWLGLRRPFLRRLAFRQVRRRPTEALLVVAGSLLGTAIIVGSFVVGDTLNASVRAVAHTSLGPIDERIVSLDLPQGEAVAQRLAPLTGVGNIDGMLSGYVDHASAMSTVDGEPRAEPRVLVWDVNAEAAARFDKAVRDVDPQPGQTVVNADLARSLRVKAGSKIVLYLYGKPRSFTVSRVIPTEGVAGAGLGAAVNRNAFVAEGTLLAAWRTSHVTTPLPTVTLVSNRGGVESGAKLTASATEQIRDALGPLSKSGNAVDTPKKDVLAAATQTGNSLGSLFLFIGSFSILAGILLLVNIFTMLAEDRKAQLGMMRAVGMKRGRLVGAFVLEGAVYAVSSAVLGVVVGIGIGRGVAFIAAQIFKGWSVDNSALHLTFAVTPTSLINGFALGVVIAMMTVLVTSIRISRFNIIAAIRDLPATRGRRQGRRIAWAATAGSAVCALLAVPAVVSSNGVGTYLLPALACGLLIPLLRRWFSGRLVNSVTASLVLMWALTANLFRPHVYDSASTGTYVVLGTLLAISAVFLVMENQDIVFWPIRRLTQRPTENGLALRMAIAYPLAQRSRTAATLAMYALVVLVLVLITEIGGVIKGSVESISQQSSAGYAVRIDYNASAPIPHLTRTLQSGRYSGQVSVVAPLVSATARSTDPGNRTTTLRPAVAVGGPAHAFTTMPFDNRMAGISTDAAVWAKLSSDSQYVVVDAFFGAQGGPNGSYFTSGDTLRLTDPRTGAVKEKTIAGVLKHGFAFYGGGAASGAFPVIMSDAAVRNDFGAGAEQNSALIATKSGVTDEQLSAELQADFHESGLVATSIKGTVRRMFDANVSFFQLMEGFLGLGLAVGITGLGVVMVRAVRERRRTIGVLRALGFRARTIELSFLLESSLIALEGIVIGATLGLLTTWLLYQNSAAFSGLDAAFPVLWGTIGLLVLGTWLASILATVSPARRAARILPAQAVRVSD